MFPQDEPVKEGYYELHLSFSWTDGRDDSPQSVTIDFQTTPSVEESYPSTLETDEDMSFEDAEEERRRWLSENLHELLDMGLITDAYANEWISSVADLESEIDQMNLTAFYY